MNFVFATLPDVILLFVGACLLALVVLVPFLSSCERGVVVDLGAESLSGMIAGNADLDSRCTSAIPLGVRLKTGSVILAEIGPCVACMEKLRPGDAVTIIKVGDRYIAQKAVRRWRSR